MVIKPGHNILAKDVNTILRSSLRSVINNKYTMFSINRVTEYIKVADWGYLSYNINTTEDKYCYADIFDSINGYLLNNVQYFDKLGMSFTTECLSTDYSDEDFRKIFTDGYPFRIVLEGDGTYTMIFSDSNTYNNSSVSNCEFLLKTYSFTEDTISKIEINYSNESSTTYMGIYVYGIIGGRLVALKSKSFPPNNSGTWQIFIPSINLSQIQLRVTGSGSSAKITGFRVYKQGYPNTGSIETPIIINSSNNIKSVFVYANVYTPGDSRVTYDISIDGGATWIEGNEINEWVDTSAYTGKDIKLRFHLIPSSDGSRSPELIDYAVMYTD